MLRSGRYFTQHFCRYSSTATHATTTTTTCNQRQRKWTVVGVLVGLIGGMIVYKKKDDIVTVLRKEMILTVPSDSPQAPTGPDFTVGANRPGLPGVFNDNSDKAPYPSGQSPPTPPEPVESPAYPTRQELISQLKKSEHNEPYDLLIIGGGATGCGVAVDAASRGLRVALVERDDFSSGTSSRSTKLVHGGVRYLEKAFWNLDKAQYDLVVEALAERANFLQIAPYLSSHLPIMIPIYKWWQLPYFWAGCKAYDLLASNEQTLNSSYLLSKRKALEAFPMLRKEHLKGAIVYYDGQHNDSRMNVALALTAIKHGAACVNHCTVTATLKSDAGMTRGATIKDELTGESFNVRARGVINATGPFTDGIRFLDNPKAVPSVAPSSGVHVILPAYYAPSSIGLIDPNTSDGRVIFFLPWQGSTIAGTTDAPCQIEADPSATEAEVSWILKEVKKYLAPDVQVRRGDVLATWSGIRPLIRDPDAGSTAELVRSHMIHVSESELLTIAGGKWTTYRAMAEETVDKAIKVFGLTPEKPECWTMSLPLVGSAKWTPLLFIPIIQRYGLETDVAEHLASSYGDQAWNVAEVFQVTGKRWPVRGHRLVSGYPYTEAEVRYCCRYEYAETAVDMIARRLRLAFLNSHAALEALPKIMTIMSEEKGWDQARRRLEYRQALAFLRTMGLEASEVSRSEQRLLLDTLASVFGDYKWNDQELARARQVFQAAVTNESTSRSKGDKSRDHRVDINKLVPLMKSFGVQLGDSYTDMDFLSLVLSTMGLSQAKEVRFGQFLEILLAAQEWNKIKKRRKEKKDDESRDFTSKIPTERSGGGV